MINHTKFFSLLLVCLLSWSAHSEQLTNQNVDISSGSTISNASGLTIQELTGGPYTLENAGTIEASNITSNSNPTIRLEVGTSVNNTGLIDTDGSANLNGILFIDNSGTNSVTNSGTIQTETSGNYGQAIQVQDASLTEITNSSGGTIKVTDSAHNSGAIRVNTGGVVNTITNDGTISATGSVHSRGIISINTATIDRIINTGTIIAQGGSSSNRGIVFWNDSGTSVTNSGTIQGTGSSQGYGIRVGDNGSISSVTNSGAITGGLHGFANGGSITNIVNTGTITGTSGYDIYNAGSITNLTNSQNNLTLFSKVPTNYYIKVNSSSSFGKITISNPSGAMNVSIADDSTVGEGTYEAVVNGVSAENISTSSGNHISDGTHYKYYLTNSSSSQWDLVINNFTAPTQCSVNSSSINCNKTQCVTSSIEKGLNALTNTNFAHMNTYDCDTFGTSGQCFSIGGRSISVNNPESDINGVVLVYGKKQSDHFRWGGFLHSNISFKTSSNLSLSEKAPMIGLYGVWNENTNKTGLQAKIGNSYQSTNAKITRPQSGISEEASGVTTITANELVLELKNNIPVSSSLTLSPYVANRYSQKFQKGYSETGVSSPLTYNKIVDNSLTAIAGLKFHNIINNKFSIYGTLGLEYDLSHNVSALSPTGVSGITTVDLEKNHQSIRPVVALGYDHKVTNNQILRVKAQYEELPYQGMTETNIYASYNFKF